MLAFVKRRWFLTLIGFVLLALFIWIAGPYFAFADYHPLATVVARVALFVGIVALWLVWRLIKRLRTAWATGQFAAAVVRQAGAGPAGPSAEAIQLRERFEEAVATLKRSRGTGRNLYDLPWYVIIGAPGSGKTTALLNSGLKFPLEQRGGKASVRGVGGTRNCDWWFTDEAVFLDTAGRYTTQDSDAASDSAAWSEFLSLLVKYRRRRPINGVILTISAPDLMTQGQRARETHVEAARRRLKELNEQLRIQLPVYVMVTKGDLVAGFMEYFDDLTQDTRAQVWGVTFPYEHTVKGEAAAILPKEFDQLIARLNARVFARIEEDRDTRRRTKIFAFPQQMSALREALSQFVSEVFESTRMERQILLRGVYFTSGTQEGTPIDRLLGAIARRYGVAADAVVPSTGRGKAYFVQRMLKDVVIAESGLAGVNRRLETRKAFWQLAAYAAMVLVAVSGLVLLTISYNRNREYIAETEQQVAKIGGVARAGPSDPVEALVPRLNAIRAVVTTADQYRTRPPWSMRWGLYQGIAVGNTARDAYVREMDATLVPRTAVRIEERLGQYAAEPEKLFEYLKAYLMLGQPNHLDKDHLRLVAGLEWQPTATASQEAGASLAQHFGSLLEYAAAPRTVALDTLVVGQARSSIQQASVPHIVYSRLKRIAQSGSAGAVRLDQAAGVGVDQVIRRRSGASFAEPIPGFFVRAGFKEVTASHLGRLAETFAADDWVWGEDKPAITASGSDRLTREVMDLYESEYISTWDRVVQDIELVPFATLAQTAEALGILAGPTSPLKGLLGAIAENTMLLEAPAPAASPTDKKTITDKLGGLFKKPAEELKGTAGSPGALVTAHFQPIHRLMAGEPGNAPIDRILQKIAQTRRHLRSVANNPKATPSDVLSDPAFREIADALTEEAAAMPPVIQRIAAQVGRTAEASVVTTAGSELEKRYRQLVVQPCNGVLPGRYPFSATSARELPMGDFERLFGYGGLFDQFFDENLQSLVDTAGPSWTWRAGVLTGSRDMLERFAAARRIRDLFFRRDSPAPDVRFTVSTDANSPPIPRLVLEIDGQYFDSDSRQVRQGVWPGPSPGRAAARIEGRNGVETAADATGTWGLFKLFDRHARRVTETRFVLAFDVAGQKARMTIDADRVDNPFARRDWQRFSCGS